MQNHINESSQRYERFGAMATEAGFRPGSGEWWQALRKFRAEDNARQVGALQRALLKDRALQPCQLKQIYN